MYTLTFKAFIVLLFSIAITRVHAQIFIKPDSNFQYFNESLGSPDFKEEIFCIRMIRNTELGDIFYELNLNRNNDWDYKRGTIVSTDINYLYEPLDSIPDLNIFWEILDSLNILNLKDYKNISISIEHESKLHNINDDEKHKFFDTYGGREFICIELHTIGGSRKYIYPDPSSKLQYLLSSEIKWILSFDYYYMAEIVNVFNSVFYDEKLEKFFFKNAKKAMTKYR